jgi:8-oxo-dGTP pyrophosphatase MutT (NUDIX family)
MNRLKLQSELHSYSTDFIEEKIFLSRFLELLESPDAYQRTHLPGHITGSAWITNPGKDMVVLVHHVNLNKWVQPGGHADGDEDILNVALREAEEETGLKNFKVRESIFDIDIHTIPARKGFPEHQHYDIRFLLEANPKDSITVSEESHDVKWILIHQLEEYSKERSVLRMKEKVLR